MSEQVKKAEPSEPVKDSSKKDFSELQEAMDSLPADDRINLRITPDGDYTMGHYKNRRKLEKTGDGHQFQIRNINGDGLTLHNTYYGWRREVELRDNMGQVYDTVYQNAIGYDFEGQYQDAEKVVKDGAAWLTKREKERLGR